MRLLIKKLSTDEIEISELENNTPVRTWLIPNDQKKIQQRLKKLVEEIDKSLNLETDVPISIDDITDTTKIIKFIKSETKINLVPTSPIWRCDSAQEDFSALQRLLSRIQTAKPEVEYQIDIPIQANIAHAATGHDRILLSEYTKLKSGTTVLKASELDNAIERITSSLNKNFIDDAVKHYKYDKIVAEADKQGVIAELEKSLGAAIKTLHREELRSANEGPHIITYLDKLIAQELATGSFVSIVEALDNLFEGEQFVCTDGSKCRIAKLNRSIQTLQKIEKEIGRHCATQRQIVDTSNSVIMEKFQAILNQMLEEFKKSNDALKIVYSKSSYFRELIWSLRVLSAHETQCLKIEFNDCLKKHFEDRKVCLLKEDGLSEEEAIEFHSNLLKMLEAFCLALDEVFIYAVESEEFKYKVSEKHHIPFPDSTNTEGFLEQSCLNMLHETEDNTLFILASQAEDNFTISYKKACNNWVKKSVKDELKTHRQTTFFANPDEERVEQISSVVFKTMEKLEIGFFDSETIQKIKNFIKDLSKEPNLTKERIKTIEKAIFDAKVKPLADPSP